MANIRNGGEKNKKFFKEGKAGCLGGEKKIAASVDSIVASEKASFKDAISKWGIDEEEAKIIDPVIITGPTTDIKLFKDGKYRGYEYLTFILGFTEKQVMIYKKEWNVYDSGTTSHTDEMFYKDVTSITTGETEGYIRFILRAGGQDFTSGIMNKRDMNEAQVQGVKSLVREKKSQ